MKTRKTILALIATLCALSSCTKQEEVTPAPTPGEPTELRLTSGITMHTRTQNTHSGQGTQGIQIINERMVHAWVDAITPNVTPAATTAHIKAWQLTANGSGGLAGAAQYYPDNALAVNIYAMHGNFSPAIGAIEFPTTLTHTVSTDQSQVAGYAASDLLYAAKLDQARSTTPAELTFYHMLSKVEVAIMKGDGVDLAGATVKIIGTRLNAEFKPAKANITEPDVRQGMITPITGTVGDITISSNVSTTLGDADIIYNEAVIVPQALIINTPIIEVTLTNGTKLYHVLAKEFTFKSGMKYRYKITVSSTGLTVSSQIAPWGTTGNPADGKAQKQMVATYKATDLKIGDYYYSDGNYSDGGLRKRYRDGRIVIENPKPTPVLNPPSGNRTVIGIVFQTDPNRIGQAEYNALVAKGVTPKGLVMALRNATTSSKWGDDGDAKLAKANSKKQCYEDISGLGNANIIKAKDSNFDNYPAFQAARDYEGFNPAPAGKTTGWFLPSIGQWWDIVQNLGQCPLLADRNVQNNATTEESSRFEYSPATICNNLNSWMIGAGTSSDFGNRMDMGYWSSSEGRAAYGNSWGKNITFDTSDGNRYLGMYIKRKENRYRVRAILAF